MRLFSLTNRFNSSTALIKKWLTVTQEEINALFNQPIKVDREQNNVTNSAEKITGDLGLLKGVAVHVYNKDGVEIPNSPFPSKEAASRALGISTTTIKRYIDSGKLYKGIYY